MRAFLKPIVLGLAILMALGGAATAAEQLTMPFACKVERGHVVLAPGQTQSYRIFGAHEQRRFTTCSPARPDQCRSWSVHRFDIDCGGARASWPSVVAAMGPFMQGQGMPGRVPGAAPPMRMGPHGYGPPSMAYRRTLAPMPGPRAYAPPPPYATRPLAPGQTVDLPSGFAPMPERLAHVTSAPEPAAPPPVTPKSVTPAPVPSVVAKEKPAAPALSPVPLPTKQPDATPAKTKDTPVEVAAAPKSGAAAKSEAARKSDKIAVAYQSPTASGDVTHAVSVSAKASPKAAWAKSMGVAGFWLAALVLLTSLLFLVRRRATGMELTSPLMREPIERQPETPAPPPAGPDAAPSYRSSPSAPAKPKPAGDSDWLPATLGEALEVLGVTPETGGDMLKAAVKRLRRTWHPDHAAGEEDRHNRERRLKQINVAWDIVCGKRRARRPSVKSQPC